MVGKEGNPGRAEISKGGKSRRALTLGHSTEGGAKALSDLCPPCSGFRVFSAGSHGCMPMSDTTACSIPG